MKEINCLTNSPISDFRVAVESLYPTAILRTNRVHFDGVTPGETLTFDPDVTVESHEYVDLKALLRGREDFLKEGLSYQKWIDKDGQVRHWHITMNPYFDPETYKFFRSIADKLEPKDRTSYVNHVNAYLPVFQLLHMEGMVYDFKDGRQLLGQGEMVFMRHPDGISQSSRDYKGKSIQTGLRPEVFVPRECGVSPDDVGILAGVRFPQIDLFGIESEIDSKIKKGIIHEDFVRELINPYFYVER